MAQTEGYRVMRKKTIKGLKEELWKIFSKYIKIRDCLIATGSPEQGECFTCNETGHILKFQAGHFISGRHNAYLFSERGVHTQCVKCNLTLGGNPHEYRRQMVKLYGEEMTMQLEEEAKQIKKFTISELEELIEYYKQKTKELV